MSDVVLVTGTSSGIGLHTAVELARRGHTVVATMRDPQRSTRLDQAAQEAGVSLDVRALDVTDHAAASDLVRQVLADHGRVDTLVNNAGQGLVGTAEQLTLEQVQAQLDVNYLGPVNLTREVMPLMRASGRGRILTVAASAVSSDSRSPTPTAGPSSRSRASCSPWPRWRSRSGSG